MPNDIIDPLYLPFTPDDMKQHFAHQADKQLSYYVASADRYHSFMRGHSETEGIPLSEARRPRQIEKDERFWAATALKRLHDSPKRVESLTRVLSDAFGLTPPVEGIGSWDECLSGDLRLFFEVCLPAPKSYTAWLRTNLARRQLIPYVLDAANGKNHRALEGATHGDAMFINADNGFALLIEAKVTSDISHSISYDDYRNQIARSIDVMLEDNGRLSEPLCRRRPDRSLFALLTPDGFKFNPKTRLYGWLMNEYRSEAGALARDLPHRQGVEWASVMERIGWVSYEEIEYALPGACPWMSPFMEARVA